jgi:protein gp37
MKTKIEWTDETANPIKRADGGNYCEKISPGCANCYASTLNSRGDRFGGNGQPFGGVCEVRPEMALNVDMLQSWARMRKSRRIFVGSMTDIFGEWVHDWMLFALFDAMANSVATFQLLTKRPLRMSQVVSFWLRLSGRGMLPANIWVGTSAEDQKRLDERLIWLTRTLAQVRFLSLEPLLGPIELAGPYRPNIHDVDWVIVGGESGPNARPLQIEWIREISGQCKAANIPLFVKQLGTCWAKSAQRSADSFVLGRYLTITSSNKIRIDKKGGDPEQWPGSLGAGARMFPEVWECT